KHFDTSTSCPSGQPVRQAGRQALSAGKLSAGNKLNYSRIAVAIEYIQKEFRRQPGLEEIAEQLHLSPFHFQRLFSEWAGTTPKKFLQYISLEHAKKILKDQQATIFDTAFETGLSGTS